jgi:hypothetical protein
MPYLASLTRSVAVDKAAQADRSVASHRATLLREVVTRPVCQIWLACHD